MIDDSDIPEPFASFKNVIGRDLLGRDGRTWRIVGVFVLREPHSNLTAGRGVSQSEYTLRIETKRGEERLPVRMPIQDGTLTVEAVQEAFIKKYG